MFVWINPWLTHKVSGKMGQTQLKVATYWQNIVTGPKSDGFCLTDDPKTSKPDQTWRLAAWFSYTWAKKS